MPDLTPEQVADVLGSEATVWQSVPAVPLLLTISWDRARELARIVAEHKRMRETLAAIERADVRGPGSLQQMASEALRLPRVEQQGRQQGGRGR